MTNQVETIEQGREKIRQTFQNGSALKKFREMIIAQGVLESVAEQLMSNDQTQVRAILKCANTEYRAVAKQTGFIQSIDSNKLGTIVQRLGKYVHISINGSFSIINIFNLSIQIRCLSFYLFD